MGEEAVWTVDWNQGVVETLVADWLKEEFPALDWLKMRVEEEILESD